MVEGAKIKNLKDRDFKRREKSLLRKTPFRRSKKECLKNNGQKTQPQKI